MFVCDSSRGHGRAGNAGAARIGDVAEQGPGDRLRLRRRRHQQNPDDVTDRRRPAPPSRSLPRSAPRSPSAIVPPMMLPPLGMAQTCTSLRAADVDWRASGQEIVSRFCRAGRRKMRPYTASVNLRLGDRRGALQEIEIAAAVGLGDVLGVEHARSRADTAAPAASTLAPARQLLVRRTRSDRRRAGTSSSMMSPSWTSASGPPTNDSGATCSTQAP